MSAVSPCVPCCPTPQIVNIPGLEGGAGTNGINGSNAFTVTTANFNIPAIGSTVVVAVSDSTWMVIGQVLIVDGPANFLVTATPTALSVTLQTLGYPGDLVPTTAILSGATVSPAGLRGGSPLFYASSAISLAITDAMDVIELTASGKTATLPTAVGRAGRVFTVKLTAVGTGTVACSGGQNIDANPTYALAAQYNFVTVVSNGANWLIIAFG